MSKDTKDWWLSERELRYPGYSSGDFPIYDAKMNSLAVGVSTRRFLDVIPESVFVRAGVPSSRDRFMSCVANTEFDTTLFVNVLLSVTATSLVAAGFYGAAD